MRVIIKKQNTCCEYEKPHPLAVLKTFPVWQERTCSIKEFDKKFSKHEGLWKSKGKNHKEILCDENECYCEENKHCRRQMSNSKFWSIEFKTIQEFEKFIKETGYLKVYIEDQDGCGITIEF